MKFYSAAYAPMDLSKMNKNDDGFHDENDSVRSRTKSIFHQLLSKKRSSENLLGEDMLLESPNRFLSSESLKNNGNANPGFEHADDSDATLIKSSRSKVNKNRECDTENESSFIMGANHDQGKPTAEPESSKDSCVIDIEPVPSVYNEELDSKIKNNKQIKKSKKKTKQALTETKIDDSLNTETQLQPTIAPADDCEILGIIIHQTDRLSFDLFISHPMVKVYMVDESNGELVRKSEKNRSVVSYYENQSQNPVNYILPIMTQPFTSPHKSILLPFWEETLIFNESFSYITDQGKSVIIFFELLDFISPRHPLFEINRVADTGGWYCIAWAFLKLRASNGQLNTGVKVRLQLYKPLKVGAKSGIEDIWKCWKRQSKLKYPSTLYVTVKPFRKLEEFEPIQRSMLALQPEGSVQTSQIFSQELNQDDHFAHASPTSKRNSMSKEWMRLPGQSCKVPKQLFHCIKLSHNGCFCVKFSNSGRFLAVSCETKDGSTIFIYDVLSARKEKALNRHNAIIYGIDWVANDSLIMSASADATVRIWNVRKENLILLLPHPSFVYVAKFHPEGFKNETILVATGCYDGVLRVWCVSVEQTFSFSLIQELEGHSSSINCLVWDLEKAQLFTGDGVGVIKIWSTKSMKKANGFKDWTNLQTLNVKELKGVSLNSLHLSPTGNKLLVHTKGRYVRVVDLKLYLVAKTFEKPLYSNIYSQSCVSPCGTLIFVPGDIGVIYVWSTITGDLVFSYENVTFKKGITCIDYHPHEHMVTFCGLDDNSAILLNKYKLKEFDVTMSNNSPNIQNQQNLIKDEVSSGESSSNRLKMVVKKLDSVMSISRINTTAKSATFHSKNSGGNFSFSDSEEPQERFKAVVNKLGELEIVSTPNEELVAPIPKPRWKKTRKPKK